MPKKRPDKQQNQEEPPLSLGRGMPQPAPVDDAWHTHYLATAAQVIEDSRRLRVV